VKVGKPFEVKFMVNDDNGDVFLVDANSGQALLHVNPIDNKQGVLDEIISIYGLDKTNKFKGEVK
jgi:hypothetical protein